MAHVVEKIELGVMPYTQAWDYQRELFERVATGAHSGALLFVEHPHVYTLGRSGEAGNMLVSDTFLKSIGAEFVRVDRGGDITYHGYGQIVGYPILNLTEMGLSLREYIWKLEQVIIDTVAHWGIEAQRKEGAVGVWIEGGAKGSRKIAAIGVRASRGVTMHGFALNVNTDLSYFGHINPCGLTLGVTSMKSEGVNMEMAQVEEVLWGEFTRVFAL